MTEYEMNNIAYKACGYKNENLDYGWWTHPEVNGGRPFLIGPWSSADAAIEHAERGGFIIDEHVAISRGQGQWVVDLYGRKMEPAIGHDKNLGLAIRDAIAKWEERNP